jgi:hypothetical protein
MPNVLFGLPMTIERAEGQQLVDDLTALWTRQMGRSLGAVDKDLDELHRFFNPVARGATLRKHLAELPSMPKLRSDLLQPPMILGAEDEALITPEGRVTISVLGELLERGGADFLHVLPKMAHAAEHLVYERYRRWSIRRIEDVLRLQAGEGQALSPPSLAFILLMLVNGSRSPETAIRRLSDTVAQQRLDEAINRVVDVFWSAVSNRRRKARAFTFYSGYPVTEPRRRLPEALSPDPKVAFVVPGGEDRVLKLIVDELRRPHRSPHTADVLAAFDQLVKVYRENLPTFAAFGMAHERPSETRRFRQRLKDALDGHRPRP